MEELTLTKNSVINSLTNLEKLSDSIRFNKYLSVYQLKEIDKFMENPEVSEFLIAMDEINVLKYEKLKQLITDERKYKLVKYMCLIFKTHIIARKINEIIDYFDNPIFEKILYSIKFDFPINPWDINTFINFIELEIDELYDYNFDYKQNINDYYHLFCLYYSIIGKKINLTKEELYNFDEYKIQFLINYFNYNNFELNTLTKFLYNKDSVKLKKLIENILKNLVGKSILSNYDLNILNSIYTIFCKPFNSQNELNTYIRNSIINHQELNRILANFENFCATNICTNLKIELNSERIDLNGQNFSMLIHKIVGYNRVDITKLLKKDISIWEDITETDSILSTSLICDRFLGTIPGTKDAPMLGFIRVNPNYILDMGPDDLFSKKRDYMQGIKSNNSDFMLFENLIEESEYYNEIVLKRIVDETVIRPDFITCFNMPNINTFTYANYFKVPIVIIKPKFYVEKMQLNINRLLKADQLVLIPKLISQQYISCVEDNDLIEKYFNSAKINETMTNLINKYKYNKSAFEEEEIKKTLLRILHTYFSISVAGFGDTSFSSDYQELEDKINRIVY